MPLVSLPLLAESVDGDPVVLGSFETPLGAIRVADSMDFRFSADTDVVTWWATSELSHRALVHTFYSTAIPLIAWAVDRLEVLHASGVRTEQGVIALSGHSGSGKSTTAQGLVARGRQRFAEDAVAFRIGPQGARAIPLPFTVNLRDEALEYFGGTESLPAVDEIYPAPEDESPLTAVVHLRPDHDSPPSAPRLTRLQAADALVCLLDNAYRFSGQPAERDRAMLEAYLEIAAEVPVWLLTHSQDFDQFDLLLDLIEEVAWS